MTTLIPNINKDYLKELFSNNNEDSIKRPDDRKINEYRQISINHITSSYNSPIKVSIGNTVSIKYVDDDEEDEYKIVGSQEADPFESKISNESPIAQALFDHKVGDVVTVKSPNGDYEVEIIDIK